MKTMASAVLAMASSAALVFGSVTASYAATGGGGRRPSDVVFIGDEARVTRVIDGETIAVTINSAPFTVKYAGLDAPTGAECYGAQATRTNSGLLAPGQLVHVEKDSVATDASGNLLRYVYLLDGRMANEEMIKSGSAKAAQIEPNILHQGDLNALEQAARTAKRGGWRACGWKSTVVKAPGACTTLQAADLMKRVATLPQLSLIADGDCVTIEKPQNSASPAWSGQYIYHPAGSTVTLSDMYIRWKDGFVLINQDTNTPGQFLAHIESIRPKVVPRSFRGVTVFVPTRDKVPYSAVLPLERSSSDASVVQLPDAGTWLFRDLGTGQYQALVDVFTYKSGDMRVPKYADTGELY